MGTGTTIRELRQAQDWGLREFARRVGVSHSHLRQIEQGERNPSLAMLRRLAAALEVDPSVLLDAEAIEEKA